MLCLPERAAPLCKPVLQQRAVPQIPDFSLKSCLNFPGTAGRQRQRAQSLPLPEHGKSIKTNLPFSPKTATSLQSKVENTSRTAPNNSCPKICSWSGLPSFTCIAPTPVILQGEEAKRCGELQMAPMPQECLAATKLCCSTDKEKLCGSEKKQKYPLF